MSGCVYLSKTMVGGIAPCHQKKLFTQFYRVPRSEEQQQKGYGIGLAQSKYIINEHGGEIMVKSAEGEGSNFYISLFHVVD